MKQLNPINVFLTPNITPKKRFSNNIIENNRRSRFILAKQGGIPKGPDMPPIHIEDDFQEILNINRESKRLEPNKQIYIRSKRRDRDIPPSSNHNDEN